MQKVAKYIVISFILSLLYLSVLGQSSDEYSVPLSNPGVPGTLIVHIIDGSITVMDHNEQDVKVETSPRYKRHHAKEKYGLKRVDVTSAGITIEERDNKVQVKHHPGKGPVDYTIKVPRDFSVNLKTINGGELVVEGVNGNHEVSNTNGPITMNLVGGSVIADALNSDIIVTFENVDEASAMMFTSLNGDVDISFPKNLKADINADATFGDVYSDFEIVARRSSGQTKKEKNDGTYKVTTKSGVIGTINGGGMDLIFKTLNGDVLIRKMD